MPVCVVEDVRKRWPNPDGVSYCGHRRSSNENIVDTLFASNNINLLDGRSRCVYVWEGVREKQTSYTASNISIF